MLGRVFADRLRTGGVAVEAQHQPLEAAHGVELRAPGECRERDPLAGGTTRTTPVAVELLELEQRSLGGDLDVGARQDAPHPAAERRDQRRLHLHALEHGDDVAGLDLVALGDRDRHDDRGRQAAHHAAVVARDPVRHAVDLDEQLGTLHRGDGPVVGAREASRRSWRPTCCVSTSTATPSTRTR